MRIWILITGLLMGFIVTPQGISCEPAASCCCETAVDARCGMVCSEDDRQASATLNAVPASQVIPKLHVAVSPAPPVDATLLTDSGWLRPFTASPASAVSPPIYLLNRTFRL